MTVIWIEPTATDNSGMTPIVTQSHQPGDSFTIGTTQVRYTFTDVAGNEATCSFTVTNGKWHGYVYSTNQLLSLGSINCQWLLHEILLY